MSRRVILLLVAATLLLSFVGFQSPVHAQNTPAASAMVRAFFLNVRSSPGVRLISRLRSNRIAFLRMGATISVLGRNASAGWLKIRTSSGLVGWISARWVLL